MYSLQAQESCYVDQPYVDTYLYTQDDFGQSFLPCTTAELYRMDIPVHNLQVGTFEALLSIYEGEGYDGVLLYSAAVTIGDEWGSYLIHTLSSPLWMADGQTYTYRLDFNGNYGTMWANFADIYPDGQNYWNGTAQATIDMGFLMHMYPLTAECSVWTGTLNNSWDEPLNWDPQQVPDSMDCVIIPGGTAHSAVLGVKGDVKDITISENAQFTLASGAELHVYHDFDLQGEAALNGLVIMKQGPGGGEIHGSPTFHKLRFEGFFALTEPVTVLDLLDVENGYVANIGTELTMIVDENSQGHVYMPGQNIVGSLTIEKSLSGIDGEPIGIPFNDMDIQGLEENNEAASISGYDACNSSMDANGLWTSNLNADSTFHRSDAIHMSSSSAQVKVCGQTSNADVHIVSANGSALGNDLRSVGNPYPSVISLEGLDRSSGIPWVTYRWNPIDRQYSAQIGDASIHDLPRIMRPLDAVLIHVPEGEEVTLNYENMALQPYQLEEANEELALTDHHIRLHIESPSGMDEALIRFLPEATWAWDMKLDGMKIASMDAFSPTLGTLSQGADVLSINSIPISVHGETMPLYVDPGVEGSVQISVPMVDGGDCFSTLHLEDRKLGYFHDFLSNGSYSTEVLLSDDRMRFILHFDRTVAVAEPSIPAEAYNALLVDPEQEHGGYEIAVLSGLLNIRPIEGIEEIPEESLVTVYSSGGKLVFQRKIMNATDRFIYQLNVSSGIYYVELITSGLRQLKKVWVD